MPGSDAAGGRPSSARAAGGAHLEGHLRGHARAVEVTHLLEQRGHAHLLEDAQAVVGAAAVGAEADRGRRGACISVMRVMPSPRIMFDDGQYARPAPRSAIRRELAVVEPHAVHADRARPEDAQPVEVADRRRAVLGERALALVLALGHVDVTASCPRPPRPRSRRGSSPARRRAGCAARAARVTVGSPAWASISSRTRRAASPASRGSARARRPSRTSRARARGGCRVARGLDDRLGVVVAVVLEVEEVDARRGAVAAASRRTRSRAQVDAVAVEAGRVRVEHAVAPGHEVEVVAEAAQQRLKGVAMRVDRAGQQGLAGQAHEASAGGVARTPAGTGRRPRSGRPRWRSRGRRSKRPSIEYQVGGQPHHGESAIRPSASGAERLVTGASRPAD